ncbi:MAG: hypothetical protein ABI675_21090 [Chitinophagaceae bacterium]
MSYIELDNLQRQILASAEQVVTKIFKTAVDPKFVFHNLIHTQQVVNAAKVLVGYYRLDSSIQMAVLLAAWFHDTGYSSGKPEDHERESERLAVTFLKNLKVEEPIIQQVSTCIMATRAPQKPVGFEEKIVCDADLYHLGTNRFIEMNKLLKQELQSYFNKEITDDQWLRRNLEFLVAHKYFTGYCKQKLEPVKKEWIKRLREKAN